MSCRGDIIPMLLAIVLPLACFVTYIIAILLRHMDPEFPYISDTGTLPPESCVFGLLFGLYAFLSAFAIFIRYLQVKANLYIGGTRSLGKGNNVALVFGLMAAFGLFIVANFQETNLITVHLCGAVLAFSASDIYFWIQTVLSYKLKDIPGHCCCLLHARVVLNCLHLGCCIAAVLCGLIATRELNDHDRHKHRFHWSVKDGVLYTLFNVLFTYKSDYQTFKLFLFSRLGFSWHVASASLEWAAAMLTSIYFLTFVREFGHFRFTSPQIKFINSGVTSGRFQITTIM